MMRSTASRSLRFFAVICSFAMVAPAAGAASIPAYTVTDLGPIETYSGQYFGQYSTQYPGVTLSGTGADGTVTTATGTVYAFPRTNNSVANPQSLLDTFPPFTNAPVNDGLTNGNPKYAYSYFMPSSVFLNQAGEFAATDVAGVDGHHDGWTTVYTATRRADGSFGPLSPLWTSWNNSPADGAIAQVLDMNNNHQLLGTSLIGNTENDYFLYNLKTGIKTELSSLLPSGWSIPSGITPGEELAIDDQGRILLYAMSPRTGPDDNSVKLEQLLLTPAGLSSNPIPAPEPSTLTILAVAGIGLAARRRWKS